MTTWYTSDQHFGHAMSRYTVSREGGVHVWSG